MTIIDGGNAFSSFDNSGFEAVNIAKEVQIYLQSDPGIQALVVAPYIGKDSAWKHGWIFDSKLQVRMENTQRCAIVVSYAGGWTAPQDSNTFNFPQVVVDIWADPTRKSDHSVSVDDARDKCFTVYKKVFQALHLLDRRDIQFGDTRIISSEALSEPELSPVTNGNGAYMLRCRFGISH